jgi:hypothetical protein
MSRFYQTAQRNYVDDFVYRPPVELMANILQNKDAEIKETISQMDLLHNLPLDYISYDKDMATRIQEEISGTVDELAGDLSKNLLDPNNRRKLKQVQQDIQQRVTSGDIYNLGQNVQAYKEYEAKLNALKDPADRELYKQQFEKYKEQNNPYRDKGDFGNVFTFEEMYDGINVFEKYISSGALEKIGVDLKNYSYDKVDDKYIRTSGGGLKELKGSDIRANFNTWLANEPGLKGYAASRQKWGNEAWLDENGNFRIDKESMIGNIIEQGLPTLAYKETNNFTKLQSNPMYERESSGNGTGSISFLGGLSPSTPDLSNIYQIYTEEHIKAKAHFDKMRSNYPIFRDYTDKELLALIKENKTKHRNLYQSLEPFIEAKDYYTIQSDAAFAQVFPDIQNRKQQLIERAHSTSWHLPATTVDNLGEKKYGVTPDKIPLTSLTTIEMFNRYKHLDIFRGVAEISAISYNTEPYLVMVSDDPRNWLWAMDAKISIVDENGKAGMIPMPVYSPVEGSLVSDLGGQ